MRSLEPHRQPDQRQDQNQIARGHVVAQRQCLGPASPGVWTLHHGKKSVTVQTNGRFKLNNVGMVRRLATLDMGLILMPQAAIADDLTSGKLRRVLPEWHGAPISVHAMTETRLLPAKTQRFILGRHSRNQIK